MSVADSHSPFSITAAAQALQPVSGKFAFLLSDLGNMGTGLLTVPMLAGPEAFAVGETRGRKAKGIITATV